jgi:uncharacterized protein YnzC (UPF0291/DUF896 family)
MEQSKIERINELSRLARERTLTEEEAAERQALRQEYLAEWHCAVQNVLDNTYLSDGKGGVKKLGKKRRP